MRLRKDVGFVLQLQNSAAVSRTVILEPWAAERMLGPGETIGIRAEGDPSSPLKIEFTEDEIVVYSFDTRGALLDFCD